MSPVSGKRSASIILGGREGVFRICPMEAGGVSGDSSLGGESAGGPGLVTERGAAGGEDDALSSSMSSHVTMRKASAFHTGVASRTGRWISLPILRADWCRSR